MFTLKYEKDIYLFSRHNCLAAGGAVMGTNILEDAPVAGPGALDARHARGVATAVVESEVARHEIFVGFARPNCQGHQGMVRPLRYGRPELRPKYWTSESTGSHFGVGRGSPAPNTLVLRPSRQRGESSNSQLDELKNTSFNTKNKGKQS